jgi:hypothetical protein
VASQRCTVATLHRRLASAHATNIRALQRFVRTVRHDLGAVQGAVTESWSNDPVEGHVNRMKTLRRQMYWRAGVALLRARLVPSTPRNVRPPNHRRGGPSERVSASRYRSPYVVVRETSTRFPCACTNSKGEPTNRGQAPSRDCHEPGAYARTRDYLVIPTRLGHRSLGRSPGVCYSALGHLPRRDSHPR